MIDKITHLHLEREAYVYVRQSSGHQVRNHKESQKLQYQLKDRARELGFHSVVVIDDDLGVTGTGTRERPGFARLLSNLCEGRVGAVLASEASRLSRNGRDWHHMIELCSLTEALIIDHECIYDPRLPNDRLLLGLKGSLSELELDTLRQRAQEALKQMVARGEVLTQVPVGYIRTDDNRCEKTPDLQVQGALEGLFTKFEEMGSARQLYIWYHREKIRFPKPDPASGGRIITWRLPKYSHLLSILKNPMYTGHFVYGRRCTRTRVVDGRAQKTTGHTVPQEEWEVVIPDHHESYITWEQYMSNKNQLANNSRARGQNASGAPRSGHAVLGGLLRCARCWRHLKVGYKNKTTARYYCRRDDPADSSQRCFSFAARKVDKAVVALVLQALQPAAVRASLASLEDFALEHDEARRQLELALEKARFDTDRARRQYDAVEPENRLVAKELEHRWNESLVECQNLEDRLEQLEQRNVEISPSERDRLLELGQDLESVWHHTKASLELKKRILRTVIEEIVVDVSEEPREIVLRVHWAGGAHTLLSVPRNRSGVHGRTTPKEAVDLIRELARVSEDPQIAVVLNRLSYRTGTGQTWTGIRVRRVRERRNIPGFDASQPRSWLTLRETAQHLEVSTDTVRRWLEKGILPGRQVVRYAPWVIESSDLELPEIQEAVKALKAHGKLPRGHSAQKELPLFSTT
jgi:DNA invertase Pin-like site-specific DNA recombinase